VLALQVRVEVQMIRTLFVTLMPSIISISCLAITIINQSGIPVAFKIDDKIIHLESQESFELPENLQNKLSIGYVGGGSSLFRFNVIGQEDEVFFCINSWERILFKIPSGEKIRPLSAYKTMIIKNADPTIYDGLAIELHKTHQQELCDLY
jgi:hypothetical protein